MLTSKVVPLFHIIFVLSTPIPVSHKSLVDKTKIPALFIYSFVDLFNFCTDS